MKKIFTPEQEKQLISAIEAAEKNTSGEIRVHIESTCSGDAMGKAQKMFHKLGMDKTDLKNGILIYLAFESRTFAIIGDKGINDKVASDFWDKTKDGMLENFKQSKFLEGLVFGVSEAGNKLKEFFPYQSNDKNELSNDISFGA
ncbi:MAG: TPM domain-containing protein [Bacteroidota bacterium]